MISTNGPPVVGCIVRKTAWLTGRLGEGLEGRHGRSSAAQSPSRWWLFGRAPIVATRDTRPPSPNDRLLAHGGARSFVADGVNAVNRQGQRTGLEWSCCVQVVPHPRSRRIARVLVDSEPGRPEELPHRLSRAHLLPTWPLLVVDEVVAADDGVAHLR